MWGFQGSSLRTSSLHLCQASGYLQSLDSGLTSADSLGLFLALQGWLIWLPESFAFSNLCLN